MTQNKKKETDKTKKLANAVIEKLEEHNLSLARQINLNKKLMKSFREFS